MRIKLVWTAVMCFLFLPAHAEEAAHHMMHNEPINYMVAGEIDGADTSEGALTTWDAFGWVGGDYHKFWWRTEGEKRAGETEEAELWALYSRNVVDFWDLQVGIRHDTQPEPKNYLVMGMQGLSRYFFESEVHAFVSDQGDVTARLEQSVDLLITQKLIMEPYAEINLAVQDIPELQMAAGIASYEIGLQTRYEFSRKFAPYIDLNYTQLIGQSRQFARDADEDTNKLTARAGLRFWF